MNRMVVSVALCMSVGCGPDPSACQADIEAERIAVAYDTFFAVTPITESQRLCVHDFEVHFQTHRHTNMSCMTSGVAGCEFDPNHAPAQIYVSKHDHKAGELGTLRHELTHLMLYCAEGDAHPAHDVPEFNFHDGPTDEPGTLMYWAKRTSVDYACLR